MIRNVITFLSSQSPCFVVDANSIEILDDPTAFYKRIVQNCQNAKFRITLASLYIGCGPLEKNLVEQIRSNLVTNSRLCVNVLLDFNRSSRGVQNSRKLLLPLINSPFTDDRCRISLYHTPYLSGWRKKLMPGRWNEIFGLQHMKLYIFDNEVIVSGANLSHEYFVNRQDRYYVIRDKNLSDFFDNLVNCVQKFSFTLRGDNSVKFNGNKFIEKFSFDNQLEIGQFRKAATKLISEFWNENVLKYRFADFQGSTDTVIYPLIEMNQLNYRNDSIVLEELLTNFISANSSLCIATGYFNMTENLKRILLNNYSGQCSILMAHPKANGFYKSRGLSQYIPDLYSLFAYKFQEMINTADCRDRVKLYEYQRTNWTFHAKGLWNIPDNAKELTSTIVGSSNFGERSYNRDLEAQMLILTTNSTLKARIRQEYHKLYNFVSPMDLGRQLSVFVYIVERFFRSFF